MSKQIGWQNEAQSSDGDDSITILELNKSGDSVTGMHEVKRFESGNKCSALSSGWRAEVWRGHLLPLEVI